MATNPEQSNVPAQLVKELRERTGAGFNDCRNALAEASGDVEREIYSEQARSTGKPEAVIEKIVNGKMEKFYEDNCLYEQHFIKDESLTVSELINQMIAKLGENISVRRFVRLKVGETASASSGTTGAAALEPVR